MKIQIRKKSKGNSAGLAVGSDVYFSKVINNGRKIGVSVRLSRRCMDSLRWRIGDKFVIDYERDGDTGTLRLTRTDSDQDGLRLSGLHKGGSGQIRASLEADHIAVMFPNCLNGYHCQIASGGPLAADFLIDYASR